MPPSDCHPCCHATPLRGGGSGRQSVGALPWQGNGSAMAVAVLGSRKGRSVDGDARLQLLESILDDDDLLLVGRRVGAPFDYHRPLAA